MLEYFQTPEQFCDYFTVVTGKTEAQDWNDKGRAIYMASVWELANIRVYIILCSQTEVHGEFIQNCSSIW